MAATEKSVHFFVGIFSFENVFTSISRSFSFERKREKFVNRKALLVIIVSSGDVKAGMLSNSLSAKQRRFLSRSLRIGVEENGFILFPSFLWLFALRPWTNKQVLITTSIVWFPFSFSLKTHFGLLLSILNFLVIVLNSFVQINVFVQEIMLSSDIYYCSILMNLFLYWWSPVV